MNTAHVPPVLDVDGPVVVLDARVCAWLVRRLNLDDVRTAVRGIDPAVDAALMAVSVASLAWRTRAGCASATTVAQPAQPATGLPLSTGEAASRLGISSQAIRKAIADKRLPATQHDGRWQIDPTDLELYRRRR